DYEEVVINSHVLSPFVTFRLPGGWGKNGGRRRGNVKRACPGTGEMSGGMRAAADGRRPEGLSGPVSP
ncbi:hypothetical protein, partial [Phocaeicola vulgatus]|uniref:hypothetical protein n=1 Tax=Phocaeicola vulgatus TaxID=821 RepID=UPI0035688898